MIGWAGLALAVGDGAGVGILLCLWLSLHDEVEQLRAVVAAAFVDERGERGARAEDTERPEG